MCNVLVLRLEGISRDNLDHFFAGNYLLINIAILEELGNPMESINSVAPGSTDKEESTDILQARYSRLQRVMCCPTVCVCVRVCIFIYKSLYITNIC